MIIVFAHFVHTVLPAKLTDAISNILQGYRQDSQDKNKKKPVGCINRERSRACAHAQLAHTVLPVGAVIFL